MATCEFCETENNVRYVNFNISILGADVCSSCEKVTRIAYDVVDTLY